MTRPKKISEYLGPPSRLPPPSPDGVRAEARLVVPNDSLDWKTSTPEEFADAIEGLCVEKNGKCQRDPCICKRDADAEDGW